jgi:hypothetical protein
VDGCPSGTVPATAGVRIQFQEKNVETADECPALGARSSSVGSPVGDSIPSTLLTLLHFLCFIRHNSKGKANDAILLMELRALPKSANPSVPAVFYLGFNS